MVLRGWGGRGGTSLAALLLAHEVDRARVLGRARLAPSLLVVRGHAVRGLLILALLAALADDVLRARVLLRAAVAPERRARVSGVGAGGGAGAHQRAFRSSGMPKFGRFFWQSSQRLLTTSMAPSCCRAQVPHQRRRRSEGSPKFARLTCAQNAAPGAQRQPAQRRAGCPLERSASFAKKRRGAGAARGADLAVHAADGELRPWEVACEAKNESHTSAERPRCAPPSAPRFQRDGAAAPLVRGRGGAGAAAAVAGRLRGLLGLQLGTRTVDIALIAADGGREV